MKLYSALAEWWPLLSSPTDYAEGAAEYWQVMSANAARPIRHLLELGCGGGNNASHLKRWCQLTLTDLSPAMLAVSRAANPAAEHIQGDMRTLRLQRQFDAVFVHDAVLYMRTEADLAQAMATAFAHCAPGGVALARHVQLHQQQPPGLHKPPHRTGEPRGPVPRVRPLLHQPHQGSIPDLELPIAGRRPPCRAPLVPSRPAEPLLPHPLRASTSFAHSPG